MDKRNVCGGFMYLTLQLGALWWHRVTVGQETERHLPPPHSFSPKGRRGRADEQFISQLFTVSLGPGQHRWGAP